MVGGGGSQDQPASKGKSLSSGTSPDQVLKLTALWISKKDDLREWHRHRQHPCV
jgi:hypothetical protein